MPKEWKRVEGWGARKVTRAAFREAKRTIIAHDKSLDRFSLSNGIPVMGGASFLADRVNKRFAEFIAAPRIRARRRVEDTNSRADTSSAVGKLFHRLEVGALNPTGILSPTEWTMATVERVGSSPLALIPYIDTFNSFVGSFAKFATADSMYTSLLNVLTSIGTGTINLPPGLGSILGYLVNSGRLNKGYDLGDQLSDFTVLYAYQALLDHPTLAREIKVNIARGFAEQYDRHKIGEMIGRAIARRGKRVIEPVAEVADGIAKPIRVLEAALGFEIPIIGTVTDEIKDVAKELRALRNLATEGPMSMRERAQNILDAGPIVLKTIQDKIGVTEIDEDTLRKAVRNGTITKPQYAIYKRWRFAMETANTLVKLDETAAQYYVTPARARERRNS